MEKAANIPAPDCIPSVYGSAIIFPVIACIIAPVMARPPPTAMAKKIFCRLLFQTKIFKIQSLICNTRGLPVDSFLFSKEYLSSEAADELFFVSFTLPSSTDAKSIIS